jgi:hypothetical protein
MRELCFLIEKFQNLFFTNKGIAVTLIDKFIFSGSSGSCFEKEITISIVSKRLPIKLSLKNCNSIQ